MNKKWECYQVDEELVDKIARKYSISKLIARILVKRNIIEDEKINVFLNPTRKDFYNPFLMPDMEKAGRKSRFPLKFTGPTYRRAN